MPATAHSQPRKITRISLLLLLLLLLLAAADLFLGSVNIPAREVWNALLGRQEESYAGIIVRGFRLPKLLTAILAGCALSVSGLLMQTTFRNPLAGPYVLGVSSGASLGAAIAIMAGGVWVANSPLSLVTSAWLGAMLTLLIVLGGARRLKSNNALLVLGIMLGAAASSGVSILQYLSNERALKSFVIWSMGSVANVTGQHLMVLAGATILGVILSFIAVRPLNLLRLGQESATSLGLSMRTARIVIFTATSLLAGATTAFCGPIGFIGIAVPHVARRVLRTGQQGPLLAGVLLLGPIAMIIADILSQLPGTGLSLPINAVASLLGLPVVIYILVRGER